MLEIRGLSRRFGDRVALDGLSLEVPPGEVVGLLGPNGSGKTTAMRTVFGVIKADAGQVLYRGAPLGPDRRRRFGYMPEERGLYPDMRVRDQVVYLARLAGLSRADARRRTDGLLERLGIADRAGEQVERLSLGNQQRVQLAAALVHEPEALVLDEPFSGLDPVAVADLQGLIRDAADRGCVVLFSSHQLDLVENVCDSVRMIDHGRLVLGGSLAELKRASGRRTLHLELEGAEDDSWAEGMRGVRLVESRPGGLRRLALDPEVDPLHVLDAARAAGQVRDFGLQLPRLSELFLEAVAANRTAVAA